MNRIQQLSCQIARNERRVGSWRPVQSRPPGPGTCESLPLRVLCSCERAAHDAQASANQASAKPSRNAATLAPIDSTA